MGVRKGDRVALMLPNTPQFVIAFYGALRAGAIVVPCNPIYKAHEMTYQLRDSGAKIIVTLSAQYPLIREIRPQTALEHVVVAQIKTYFPPHLRVLFTLLREAKSGHRVDIHDDANTYWWSALLKGAPERPEHVDVRPEDTAVLMYTGGTTGVSKGAELTHRNILVNAHQCEVWLNAQEAREVGLVQVPLFHSYGMTTCMNLAVLVAETLVLIPDPRDLKDILDTMARYRPTLYPGVPAMYNSIVNYPGIGKYDLRSIRACVSGAASLPVEVQRRFQELTGAHLVEGYGLSEASPVVAANPISGDNRIGTIGVPWPDTDIMLVDTEGGEGEVAPGDPGELCVRGPQVMKGYWNKPDETAIVLRIHHDGAWLHTGDIVTMDAGGYLHFVDRKKDMILGAGGYNVYPREIEDVLYEHPAVLEAVALGVPCEAKGERIEAFVVPKPGQHPSEEELIGFCRQRLAPYKVPKQIQFSGELPKTLVGKPLRRLLRDEEMKKVAAGRA
jgi:long-chain acyl-CoA synthetase